MNTTKKQFSIGLDGSYFVCESITNMLVATVRKYDGVSLIRGR